MFTKILVASDGSECALKAAEKGAALAKAVGVPVTVLHVAAPYAVMPLVGAPGMDLGVDFSPELVRRYIEELKTAVERRTGAIFDAAGVAYTIRHETGNAAELIVETAEKEGFDLIVMGSRGLGQFKSLFLGSVSDRVTHHAHCPVLIVK
jgi:nucleotide-binding universal stress UspA family protein